MIIDLLMQYPFLVIIALAFFVAVSMRIHSRSSKGS